MCQRKKYIGCGCNNEAENPKIPKKYECCPYCFKKLTKYGVEENQWHCVNCKRYFEDTTPE